MLQDGAVHAAEEAPHDPYIPMMKAEDAKPAKAKPQVARVKDVAKAAGVSVATVSRAFNLPDTVSDEARKLVLEVAKGLGYRPNPAAKALRLQRTFMVGAVFPTTDYGFYARLLSAFQDEMHQAGYLSVLLTVGFDNSRIFDAVRQLVERGMEALMVVGRIDDPRLLAYLLDAGIPVVCTYSSLQDAPFPSVGIDNYAATSAVMRHLLDLGHREFAMLSGPTTGNDRQQARRKAFRDTLAAAGITGAPRVFEDPQGYSLSYGVRAFRQLVEQHPEVTALVCNSDGYGMATLLEAKRMGIRVPEQLSVTGFDDQEFAALLDPPLTTVSVKADAMGIGAARALLHALQHGEGGDSQELEAILTVRGSTAMPPPK